MEFLLEIFWKNVILELCKGVHCVDLGESFQTIIWLQKSASLQGSFSAVSAPIFASKYAFDSIFQNLPDSQAEIPN